MNDLVSELRKLSNPHKAETYKNFHKTDEGDYAHGEIFLGLTVPQLRTLAKKHHTLSLIEIDKLLNSRVHEEKYVAALILIYKYEDYSLEEKRKIAEFCLKNTKKFTGWDLVDSIAPSIIGNFLLDKDKSILARLAKSDNLWEKRISIVSTYSFIKKGEFNETLQIAKILLNDKHDLIHKACGWMLREVGKRDERVLEMFLKDNYSKLPRTTLRYAIERFSENKREAYLKGKI